jgi:hypothetical protein
MARKYKRDGSGRFAGGGGGSSGGGSKRPAAKTVSRGVNRLTRDNAGKITSVGGEGATARGGRLRTAAGNKRAMQTAKVSGGKPSGTMKGKVKRDPGAMPKVGRQPAKPAAKLPREQRLARATATASRIAKKRKQAADETGAAFAERRRISGRASSKARSSAFAKEAVAGKQSASALQSFLRADNRESNLITALGKERQAARTAAPKPAAASKTPSNKIAASPRQLSRNEQTARDVMTNKSFRSDRQRIAEMQRRGIDRNTDFVGLVANVRAKQGGGTTAKIKPASKPAAAPKSTARPLSQRETQSLGLAKSNLSINKQRLAGARESKAKAKGPLEKLKATDRINEYQTNIRESSKKITAINARPAPGRPITGADRSGNRKQLSAPKKSGAIKGSIKRDASASSNLKNKSGLNAGKYKNIYMANANKAAAAKRKRKP